MQRTLWRALAVATAATITLTGCGGDDDDDDAAGDSAAATEAPAADDGGEATEAPEATAAAGVTIVDFTFTVPASVAAGEAITVTNNDGPPHTFTDDNGAFDTASIAGSGGTATVTIAEAGEYSFHCEIHPSMTGTIVVE
jgi:plastocyanin